MSHCDCQEEPQQTSELGLKIATWNTLLEHKKILINGVIDDSLIEKAVIQIILMNEYDDEQEAVYKDYERTPITIYINTDGGEADNCFALLSAMDSSETPIKTVVLGKAYSAGFLILISGHERCAGKYSTAMYHQGSAGIYSVSSQIIEYAEYIKKTQNIIEGIVLDKTKITKERLLEVFEKSQNFYMNAEEMVENGVVDYIC